MLNISLTFFFRVTRRTAFAKVLRGERPSGEMLEGGRQPDGRRHLFLRLAFRYHRRHAGNVRRIAFARLLSS